MREPLHLQIPQPCHENWAAMIPEEKGKFCLSCQKTVVDFSVMTDRQVLEYFSSYTGSTCGRFAPDQLNRDIVPGAQKPTKWYKYLLSLFVPAMLLATKSYSQGATKRRVLADTTLPDCKVEPPKGKPKSEEWDFKNWTMGDVSRIVVEEYPRIISGKVIDEEGEPVRQAKVQINGTVGWTMTDSAGRFNLLSLSKGPVTLGISHIDKKSKEVLIDSKYDLKKPVEVVLIGLEERTYFLAGFVIIAPKEEQKPPTVFHKFNRFITDSLGSKRSLTLYPNAAKPGSAVTVSYNLDKGRYFIRLINANGQTMQQDAVNVETKSVNVSFRLHNLISAGQYVVAITDSKGKRVTSGQLIVQ